MQVVAMQVVAMQVAATQVAGDGPSAGSGVG